MKRLAPYLHPHLLAVLAMGFSSGLPLALTASTLSVWLAEAGVSKAAIGLFGGVGIAYSFKVLWSPLLDNISIPFLTRRLGRRRSWLIVAQAALAVALIALGGTDPGSNPFLVGLFALAVAFCSATQDTIVDAYRVERLTEEQQPAGAAMGVLGYRLGMIASTAGALYLATYYGWQVTYLCMAALVFAGGAACLMAGEPPRPALEPAAEARRAFNPLSWYIDPLREFMSRPGWLALMLFIFCYKLPDAFLGMMASPFYLETGFTKTQIADVAKLYGLLASIGGGFLGVWMVKKWGLMHTLWVGGIACAATNLLFIPLIAAGPDTRLLAGIITFDNASAGVAGTALVAYMSAQCKREFTATQYALLTSLFTVSRTLFSTPAGWVAEQFGWLDFFVISTALAVPGLLALAVITRRRVHA